MNIYLKLVLTAIIWGGTFVAGKVVAENMGTFSAAFWRFLIAALILLVFVDRSGGLPKLNRRQIIPIILLGLTGVFAYNVFFFFGLKLISASRAALIIALNPVAIALGSTIFAREKLLLHQWIGIPISLIGASIVITKGNPLSLFSSGIDRGEMLIIGCVASWATYTLIGKQIVSQISALATATYACIVGAILLLIPALLEGLFIDLLQFNLTAWSGVVYLAIFGSAIAFSWYYEGVAKIGAAQAGIFINLVPPSAVILAALILGDDIDISAILGGILVVFGVILTNYNPLKK
jgi:drug/metabolite transporter (DMT)-like permease